MFNIFQVADNDQSLFYLGQIFGNVGSALSGTGSALMATLFKTFNTSVLALGAILVTYVTVVGLMNTAHEGEFLGKKFHSTWTPVKMVIGIAGLVPTGSGYCAIQMVIMWLIVQGVGAADTLWKNAIDYLGANSPITSATAPNQNDPGGYINKMTSQLFSSLVCQSLVNKVSQNNEDAVSSLTQCSNGNPAQAGGQTPSGCDYPSDPILYAFGRAQTSVDSGYNDPTDECGYVAWAKDQSALRNLGQMAKAQQGDLQVILPTTASLADYYVKSVIDDPNCWQDVGCPDKAQPCYFGKYNSLVMANIGGQCLASNPDQAWANLLTEAGQNFVKMITLHLAGSASNYASMPSTRGNTPAVSQNGTTINSNISGNYQKAQANGWIFAGGFYYYIARQNNQSSGDFLTYIKALVDSINQYPVAAGSVMQMPPVNTKNPAHANYADFSMRHGYDSTVQTLYTSASAIIQQGLGAMQAAANIGGGLQVAQGAGGPSTPGSDLASSAQSIMSGFMGLITSSNPTDNPIVTIQNFGQSLLNGAEVIFWVGFAIAVTMGFVATNGEVLGTTVNVAEGLGFGMLMFFLPMIFFVEGYLILMGGFLGVYFPLIPYTIFTFSVIGWLTACIEAMVAGPIVAIGILSPAGQHEILGRADPATMILMNIFLRPTLLVIGMFAGMLLSYVVIELINAGFSGVIGSLMPSSGMGLIEMFLFVVVYASLVTTALGKCFALIHILPNQVLRWIGGHPENYGEEQSLAQIQQGASSGSQAASSAAGGVGNKAQSTTQQKQQGRAEGRKENQRQEERKADKAEHAAERAEDKAERAGGSQPSQSVAPSSGGSDSSS